MPPVYVIRFTRMASAGSTFVYNLDSVRVTEFLEDATRYDKRELDTALADGSADVPTWCTDRTFVEVKE